MPRRVGVAFSMVTCASCAVKLGWLGEMELRFAMILEASERVEGREDAEGVGRRCVNVARLIVVNGTGAKTLFSVKAPACEEQICLMQLCHVLTSLKADATTSR